MNRIYSIRTGWTQFLVSCTARALNLLEQEWLLVVMGIGCWFYCRYTVYRQNGFVDHYPVKVYKIAPIYRTEEVQRLPISTKRVLFRKENTLCIVGTIRMYLQQVVIEGIVILDSFLLFILLLAYNIIDQIFSDPNTPRHRIY